MILIIMRHGKAGGPHPLGDGARSLVSAGHQRNRLAADYLARKEYKIDRVMVSPLIRSLQTAQDLSEVLDLDPSIFTESPFITPFGDEAATIDEIEGWRSEGSQCLLMVSHNPFVTHFGSLLLEESHQLNFKTSSILIMDFKSPIKPGAGRFLAHESFSQ